MQMCIPLANLLEWADRLAGHGAAWPGAVQASIFKIDMIVLIGELWADRAEREKEDVKEEAKSSTKGSRNNNTANALARV